MDILYALQRADVRLFQLIFHGAGRPSIRTLARAISATADGYLLLLVPLLLWLAGKEQTGMLVSVICSALAVQLLLYWLMKNSLKRPRPQDSIANFSSLIVAADKFSFPSGHTAAAFLLATSLSLVYGGAFIGMYLWACAVAASRVILGVHYPGDTLAGSLIGSGTALFMYQQLGG